MDYLIRCPACSHSVAEHGTDGCQGEQMPCACRCDRDMVLLAVARHDWTRYAPAIPDDRLDQTG